MIQGLGRFHVVGNGFVPTDIGGCVLWLRSDLGITQSGGLVSSWADQSGSGNDFIQATDSKKPVWYANGLLSDDVDDLLTSAGCIWQENANGFSLFVLTKPTSTSAYGYLLTSDVINGGLGVTQYQGTWRVGSAGVGLYATGVECDNNYQMLSYECATNLPASQADVTIVFRKNDGESVDVTPSTKANTNGTSLFYSAIDQSNPYGGYLDEVVIYVPRLSVENYTTVQDYLLVRRSVLNA